MTDATGTPTADRQAVGERIKEARESAGMGVGELAQAVGISRSHLYNIEGGRMAASPPVYRLIAIVLNVDETELLGGAQQ